MAKMQVQDFCREVERCEPGLLGIAHVSHEVVGDRVHLIAKDSIDGDNEVWIYANDDGTFTYQRGDFVEKRKSVEYLVEAVFGNESGEV